MQEIKNNWLLILVTKGLYVVSFLFAWFADLLYHTHNWGALNNWMLTMSFILGVGAVGMTFVLLKKLFGRGW